MTFFTLGLLVFVFWYSNYLMSPARSSGAPLRVEIPLGANVSVIADRLKNAGAIRSGLAFKLMARLYGGAEDMKAGEYLIPPNRGVLEIIDQLVAGNAEAQLVLIPEGYSLSRIATHLEEERLVRSGVFMRMAHRSPQSYGLDIPVSRHSLEGYLMPDTYKFARRSNERAILKQMLQNWKTKIYEPNRKLFAQSSLPLEKIIVIASMIEREAQVEADRPLISSVIRNRLAKDMPLQIDATVLYALGRHKSVVTYKDLKVKSPYNTYAKKGLPPGPICNPGVEAVKAALNPPKTPYLYYVARPDGSHIFTKTHAEHLQAIARVKKLKAEAKVAAARTQ